MDYNGITVTINGQKYSQMLRNIAFHVVENTPGMWWQQGGTCSLSPRDHAVKATFWRKNNFQYGRVLLAITLP